MNTDMKYTLITGGSRGIGYGLARECAGRGMNLLLVARQQDTLEEVVSEISKEFPVKVHGLAVDLRDSDGPLRVWEWCRKESYRVDILINNAGVAGSTSFESSDPEYSDDRILVNIRALVLLTRYFLTELKTHPQSHILNMGSLSAYYPIAYKSVYSASKAFVHYFSRSLRQELKGSNISITVIHPNGVRTNEGTFKRIDSHSGITKKLFVLELDEVSRIAVNGMLKHKSIVVPGFANRMLIIITRLFPAAFRERRMANMFRKELGEIIPRE
jgi:short-subunit dehydrogenase